MLRGNKPKKHLTQFVQSNFSIQIQHEKYKEYDTLFIGMGGLENKKSKGKMRRTKRDGLGR